jgi:uncharacterized membrane protein (UPF0127 family)
MRFLRLCCGVMMAACLLSSCSSNTVSFADMNTQEVTLPGGQTIRAQAMIRPEDQLRGMMFRTSLAPDHGMLFVHKTPGLYSTFMYQHEIPLDILWMDTRHNIVEIVENAQPCRTAASQCPHYGGTKVSQYILELAGGMARKYGLQVGQRLDF